MEAKPTHVGIDGDILLYQAAFAPEVRGYICYDETFTPLAFFKYKKDTTDYPIVQPYNCVEIEDIPFVCGVFTSKVNMILRATGAKTYTLYLTGKDNFRTEIYPLYKSSRGAKPLLYNEVRAHALRDKFTVVVDGQEADDALSIAQYKNPKGHIIASIDKDLLMVPGHHYNFNKDVTSFTTEEEGLRTFYKQILTGDATDDIPGIKGIGPKKAEKILEECETAEQMWYTALDKWAQVGVDEATVIKYGQLLWMREYDGEYWEPPREIRQ